MKSRTIKPLSAAILLALVVPAAWAQSEDQATVLDEVLVTAQKREERVVEVPISLAVASGETLARKNLSSATDLQYVAPGLTYGDSNTLRGAGFRIRGIGTTVFADGIEQSVGTVVDGIPLARAGQGLVDLIDLERVEVLRGPQGMLFGRNASAGLINVITRVPGDDFEARANASLSGSERKLGAALSGPLVEGRVRLLGSVYKNERDGVLDNLFNGAELNNRSDEGGRLVLALLPNEQVDITLRADYSRSNQDCCIWSVRQFANASTDPRPLATSLPNPATWIGASLSPAFRSPFTSTFVPSLVAGPENRNVFLGGANFGEQTNDGLSAEINWALGDYTLTSLTARRNWSQSDNNDSDSTARPVLDRNGGGNELSQFSQELRITSPDDGRFSWVGGLFYFSADNEAFNDQAGRITFVADALLPPGFAFGRRFDNTIEVEDIAVFGEGTFALTDRVNLIAGLRYTDTEVSLDYRRIIPAGRQRLASPNWAPLAFDASTSDTNLSWRMGLQYELEADANLYATLARGYKGPGYNSLLDVPAILINPTGNPPAGQPDVARLQAFTEVAPEIPTSIEFGYKALLADRRLEVAAAVFHTTVKDFQAQVTEVSPLGGTIFAIRNAGELRSRGFEFSATARPTDQWSFGASLAYVDATFTSFARAGCPRAGLILPSTHPCSIARVTNASNPGGFFDATGARLQNAPKWTTSVDARYDFRAEALNANAFVQGNFYWRSSSVFSLFPSELRNDSEQPAYGLLNASVGLAFADDRIIVSLWGKNLLDKNFVTSIFDLPFDGVGGYGQFVTPDAERQVGVGLNVRW